MSNIEFNDDDAATYFMQFNFNGRLNTIHNAHRTIISEVRKSVRDADELKESDRRIIMRSIRAFVPLSAPGFLNEVIYRNLKKINPASERSWAESLHILPLGYQLVILDKCIHETECKPESEENEILLGNLRQKMQKQTQLFEQSVEEVVAIKETVKPNISFFEKVDISDELAQQAKTVTCVHHAAELSALAYGILPYHSQNWNELVRNMYRMPEDVKVHYIQQLLDYQHLYNQGRTSSNIDNIIEIRDDLKQGKRVRQFMF